MSSRVALRGSYRQHSLRAIRIGRPQPQDRMEVTLVLRRKQKAPHPWAADRYHTHEELAANYGADPADIEAVEAIAAEHHLSIAGIDPAARTIAILGSFSELTSLFGADVELHRIENRTYRSRRGHMSIPQELVGRVTAVLGFDSRPVARSVKSFKPHNTDSVSYTPTQIAELYNFPKGSTGKGQTIALIELGGGYRNSDLKTYWKKLGLENVSVSSVAVSGAHNRATGNPDGPDGEVVLDIEVAGAVAPQAKVAVYFAPNTEQGFLKAINAAIYDKVRKPSVISISWGGAESNWTRQALDAFNQTFHDASLLGITVFAAAGDDGSADGAGDGQAHVDFPASSPWVVACGGTSVESAGGKITREAVWNDGSGGATGGGVSAFFPLPDYQSNAGVPPCSTRPKFAGRGVPDISGCADPLAGYFVLVDGTEGVVGGTSAVAPLWAGLTAIINSELGARVGFMNPLIYGTFLEHKALNDITQGTNGDFRAKPQWDGCTGMGSPNGQAILDVLKQIQQQQIKG